MTRKTVRGISAAVVGLFAFLWLIAWEPALEDSFITFRVARNLREGHGLVYNPGEHVEAQSNMLWTLLVAPMGGLSGHDAAAAQVLGFFFGLSVLGAVVWVLRRPETEPWDLLLPLALVLFSPYFLTFTVYGLETPMQALFFLLLAGALGQRRWTMAGCCLGLFAWCRPEGYYFAPLIVAYVFLSDRKTAVWKSFLPPALGLPLALALFRIGYYGQWQPNTVYAKAAPLVSQVDAYLEKVGQGAGHLSHFFLDARLIFWLPLLAFGLFRTPPEYRRLRNAAVTLIAIQTLFILASGGNVFGRYRFLSAVYPLLAVLAGLGWLALRRLKRGKFPHEWVAVGLAWGAVFFQVEYERSGWLYWQGRVDTQRQYQNLPEMVSGVTGKMFRPPDTLNARLGLLLREELATDAVIVTGQIGQIAYFSRRTIVDIVGLADRTIAHEGISLDYLLSRDPDMFLLLGANQIGETPNLGVGSGLVGSDRFRSRYAWTRVYRSDPPLETFYRFDRRPQPLAEPIRTVERPQIITISLQGGK